MSYVMLNKDNVFDIYSHNYAFLYENLRTQNLKNSRYWHIFMLMKKAVISFSIVILFKNSMVNLAAILITNVAMLYVAATRQPFENKVLNVKTWLSEVFQVILVLMWFPFTVQWKAE
jgi:hypothetical protein